MRDVTGRYWVCQSLWDSFLYLGKLSLVSISAAILFLRSWHVYFPLEFEFRGKSCVEREHGEENGISCLLRCILLLYIEWIWTNYCKLSRNFVGAIRTATINCRVSFIDLHLVFPRNFWDRIFTPHKHCNFTGTVLWYYHRAWVTCDFSYPISDLIKNLIPYFRPEAMEPGAWPERVTSC